MEKHSDRVAAAILKAKNNLMVARATARELGSECYRAGWKRGGNPFKTLHLRNQWDLGFLDAEAKARVKAAAQ